MLPEPSRAGTQPDAVLCDPMGILLRLESPVPRLIGSLAARGVMVDQETAIAALSAIVETYRAEHLQGVDQAAVMELRRHTAEAMRAALPQPLDPEKAYQVVMGLIRFAVLPGTRDALLAMRDAGIRIGFASDWDATLEVALLASGIGDLADVAVASAQVGEAKPSPATLRLAIERLGLEPSSVLVLGQPESDGAAAQALGAPFRRVSLGSGIDEIAAELLG